MQAQLDSALGQLERTNASEAKLQRSLEELVQKLTTQDIRVSELSKELQESKELVSWYETQPFKAAGLKKCNKCKRYSWQHSEKACLNYQCALNIKTVCIQGTQTGEVEEEDDSGRFEEVEDEDRRQQQEQEHEERMRKWREDQEALVAGSGSGAGIGEVIDVTDEEPPHKRPRHQYLTHFIALVVRLHFADAML